MSDSCLLSSSLGNGLGLRSNWTEEWGNDRMTLSLLLIMLLLLPPTMKIKLNNVPSV